MSKTQKNLLQRLRNAGFDRSYAREDSQHCKVACSQCEALVINGVACHETGCPNQKKSPRGANDDD